jgi:hypothetical protein
MWLLLEQMNKVGRITVAGLLIFTEDVEAGDLIISETKCALLL